MKTVLEAVKNYIMVRPIRRREIEGWPIAEGWKCAKCGTIARHNPKCRDGKSFNRFGCPTCGLVRAEFIEAVKPLSIPINIPFEAFQRVREFIANEDGRPISTVADGEVKVVIISILTEILLEGKDKNAFFLDKERRLKEVMII